jgi:hypothetical protein
MAPERAVHPAFKFEAEESVAMVLPKSFHCGALIKRFVNVTGVNSRHW